jgi:hypothetical protein
MISAIVLYFINRPNLDFDLTKAANIADLPVLFKTIRKKIVDVISLALVCPRYYLIIVLTGD